MSEVAGHNVVYDPAEAYRLLMNERAIAFDSETTGFSPWRDNLALLQFYGDQTGTLALIRTPEGHIPQPIVDLLESRKRFIVHNGVSFDIPFLSTHGVDVTKAEWHDTLVAETAIIPTDRRNVSVSLKASVRRRLGLDVDKDIEHSNWGAEQLTEDQVRYAAGDVIHLPALMRSQLERAKEAGVLDGLKTEMRLVLPTAFMTITGMPFSVERWEQYITDMHKKRDAAWEVLKETFPDVDNWRSSKQVGEALEKRGVVLPRTPGGSPSTRAEVLEALAQMPGPAGHYSKLILDFRHPDQRIKTYTRDWVDQFVESDGRIHAKFWQCGTDTLRYSSSNPNLQQIPRDMRWVFGWVPGYKMMTPDYSQIEVLITAAVAGDQRMLEMIHAGSDMHAIIQREVLHIPDEEQTVETRKFAKAITFTLMFGGSVKRIIEYVQTTDLDISEEEIYSYVNNFFEMFSGIRDMRNTAQARASRRPKRPVTIRLPSGAKRMLVGKKIRSTVIINTMVQGSAAIGIKFGMLEAWDRGIFAGNVCSQVHDELPCCVPNRMVEDFGREIKDCMETGMERAIGQPCKVKVKEADEWQS